MASYLTNSIFYQEIAGAIREQNGTSTSYYPKEMAPAISLLSNAKNWMSCPFFDNLSEALAFYSGQHGDAVFYTAGGFTMRGSLGLSFTDTISTSHSCNFVFVSSDTQGMVWPYSMTHTSGTLIDYAYYGTITSGTVSSATLTTAKLTMLPNLSAIASRSETYNGSTSPVQEVSVDNAVFFGSYTFQSAGSLKSVSANNCLRVSSAAFKSASQLQHVTMPNLKTAGYAAFGWCSQLQSVDFPSLTSTNALTFACCTNLSIANVPNISGTLNSSVFKFCSALETLYLGSVTAFSASALYGCNQLESLDLPLYTTQNSANAYFTLCPNLITFNAPLLTTMTNPVGCFLSLVSSYAASTSASLYGNMTNHIQQFYTPNWCLNNASVAQFFRYQQNMTDVTLGLSFSIAASNPATAATVNCYNLEIPEELQNSWGNVSVSYVKFGISNVFTQLAKKVNKYDDNSQEKEGTTINLPNISILSLNSSLYLSSSTYTVYTSTGSISKTYYPYRLLPTAADFYYNRTTSLSTEYVFCIQNLSLSGVTSIGSYCFADLDGILRNVYFENCKFIGQNAFQNCPGLRYASFPSCSYVGYEAFMNCDLLSQIYLPTCSIIQNFAFSGCSSLQYISLPLCSSIGVSAFRGCKSLSQIFLLSTSKVLTMSAYISSLFSRVSYFTIYVPSSLLAAYQTDTTYGWSYYSSYFSAYKGG